jgi:putative protein kinase ArgK-like GTPase of G3E family
VRDLVDVVVLLLQPETGDELQWEKAGVLEVADVIVIHKADLPGADRVEGQVRALLNLPGCREMRVVRVSARAGQGLEELYQMILDLPLRRTGAEREEGALLRLAQQRVAEQFHLHPERVRSILDRWQSRNLNDTQAADELLFLLREK